MEAVILELLNLRFYLQYALDFFVEHGTLDSFGYVADIEEIDRMLRAVLA